MKMLAGMKKRKGFTLIELIVVMAIIAILVLLAAPKYLNYTKDAHVTAMQQDAKVLQNIALAYNVKSDGEYPVAVDVTAGVDTVLGTADDVITHKAFADAAALTTYVGTINGTVVLENLEEGITGVGTAGDTLALAVAPAVGKTTLELFDKTKVTKQLQGLKNDLGDYALITSGTHEGEVVYLGKVLENSDGAKYVSVKPIK